MLDISDLKHQFSQLLFHRHTDPLLEKMIAMDETDDAFSWAIAEAIHRLLKCRIDRHYKYDLGEHLFYQMDMLQVRIETTLTPLRLLERRHAIKRVKVMVLDNLLVLALR